jgi:hypothetical protein
MPRTNLPDDGLGIVRPVRDADVAVVRSASRDAVGESSVEAGAHRGAALLADAD